jgi:hypothetical protein
MSQRSGDWGRGLLITELPTVLVAQIPAKTVTSFLTLLSVLVFRVYFMFRGKKLSFGYKAFYFAHH